MQPAIRVENLSKRYQLGLTHAGSVRELVNGAVAKVFGRGEQSTVQPVSASESDADHIWALRDVSFEVNPGEAIGIIGRNGAGKSTLLKLLSRITRPTGGRIELHGRVASLLEVGTGFHPELTGRENVYMNGTILGMTKKEIKREFDSIVAFAEVERFIDTPVKRYSSGMTVRLGFAVAAHLNPEILIVDEVLAVGDADFQKRCLGKMDDIARSGRTVLFVSHNMASIRQLTSKAIMIEDGGLAFHGGTEDALDHYLGHSLDHSSVPLAAATMKRLSWAGDRSAEFLELSFAQEGFSTEEGRLGIHTVIGGNQDTQAVWLGVTIHQSDGSPVASAFGEKIGPIQCGQRLNLQLQVDITGFAPGHYWLRLGLLNSRNQLVDLLDEVLPFSIDSTAVLPDGFSQWNPGWGQMVLNMKCLEI
jgi:lipopolysaccharide transport system ATP-binding protein